MHTLRATLPPEIYPSAATIRITLKHYRCVSLLATIDDAFAGFAMGFFYTFDHEPEIAAIGDPNIFHLFLNVIAPSFQGQGIGLNMIERRIAHARRRGARTCTCFSRSGASLHNLLKTGGEVIGVRENYQGSQETVYIVKIDISE